MFPMEGRRGERMCVCGGWNLVVAICRTDLALAKLVFLGPRLKVVLKGIKAFFSSSANESVPLSIPSRPWSIPTAIPVRLTSVKCRTSRHGKDP